MGSSSAQLSLFNNFIINLFINSSSAVRKRKQGPILMPDFWKSHSTRHHTVWKFVRRVLCQERDSIHKEQAQSWDILHYYSKIHIPTFLCLKFEKNPDIHICVYVWELRGEQQWHEITLLPRNNCCFAFPKVFLKQKLYYTKKNFLTILGLYDIIRKHTRLRELSARSCKKPIKLKFLNYSKYIFSDWNLLNQKIASYKLIKWKAYKVFLRDLGFFFSF